MKWRQIMKSANDSVFEEFVEAFFLFFLGVERGHLLVVGMDCQARLEEVAEIRFFLYGHGSLDRFPALPSGGRVEMAATAASAQVGQTLRTGIGAHYFTLDAGGASAIPA